MPLPAHEPTDATQEAVATLTATGWPQSELCKLLGITLKTLRKYYRDELDSGSRHVHAALATKAVSLALAGDKTMLCFVLKTKFGWRERERDSVVDGSALIAGDTDPEVAERG